MTDVMTTMVEAAAQAPSIHNCQPWQFAIVGETVEVRADLQRATPVIDPVGRGLHLACGAAVLNAFVAGRAAGRAVALTVGPFRGHDQLLATLALGGSIAPPSADVALAAAVPRRHTVRAAFEPMAVPQPIIDQLRAATEREGAWMAVVKRPSDIVELAVLTHEAGAAENADERFRAEMSTWLRADGDDRQDGIPIELVEATEVRGTDVPLRDFLYEGRPEAGFAGGEPPAVENPLLVVIGTDGDQTTDWLRAGMALQRLWLTATALGLGASPITQALDHAGSRSLLARIVGLEHGHPQMVLRIGYSTPAETTGRRSLRDVLVRT